MSRANSVRTGHLSVDGYADIREKSGEHPEEVLSRWVIEGLKHLQERGAYEDQGPTAIDGYQRPQLGPEYVQKILMKVAEIMMEMYVNPTFY